jgi:hypothetical protein
MFRLQYHDRHRASWRGAIPDVGVPEYNLVYTGGECRGAAWSYTLVQTFADWLYTPPPEVNAADTASPIELAGVVSLLKVRTFVM